MEKIAVHCPTKEIALKVIKKSSRTIDIGQYKDSYDTCAVDGAYAWFHTSKTLSDYGYKIINAEDYLAEGRDMEFKVGDKVRAKKVTTNDMKYGEGVIEELEGFNMRIRITKESRHYKEGDLTANTDWGQWLELIEPTTKNEVKEKESDMAKTNMVTVLIINRENDKVLVEETVTTSNLDALRDNLLVKHAPKFKGIDVGLLHFQLTTVTSYDKPEPEDK